MFASVQGDRDLLEMPREPAVTACSSAVQHLKTGKSEGLKSAWAAWSGLVSKTQTNKTKQKLKLNGVKASQFFCLFKWPHSSALLVSTFCSSISSSLSGGALCSLSLGVSKTCFDKVREAKVKKLPILHLDLLPVSVPPPSRPWAVLWIRNLAENDAKERRGKAAEPRVTCFLAHCKQGNTGAHEQTVNANCLASKF